MTNNETTPQSQEAPDPAAQEMQRRIDGATMEQVWDGLMLHAADIAEKTKHIETARAQGRDIPEQAFMNYVEDATEFQAVGTLYREWSGLKEDRRPGFKNYVDEQYRQQHSSDAKVNAPIDSKRANELFSASAWMDENFDKTMRYSLWAADRGEPAKRPENEFGLGSANFMKHKMEHDSKIADMRKTWQQEQVKEEQEAQQSKAVETTHKDVVVDKAKSDIEAIHDQSELTAAVVKMGKDRTFIHANFKRGFTKTLGDMPREDANEMYNDVTKVQQIFGTDPVAGSKRKDGWHNSNGESVLFMPVVEHEYRTETRNQFAGKNRFGKVRTREVPYQVEVPGSEHQKMVVNPETGQHELAVLFRYDFDGSMYGVGGPLNELGYMAYGDTRAGNMLQVAVELPQSVADKLYAQVQERPAYVRELVEALVMNNSGGQVEASDWVERINGASAHGMKPPYTQLKELVPDWKIAIAVPKPGATLAELGGSMLHSDRYMEVTRHKV